ncbi:MAG TPA: Hpt domain-containing protein [Candidatus Acidoferrales bacterium]|nr:Hpt domain-containing protein [Candidatus Acidoferrales bacterium]
MAARNDSSSLAAPAAGGGSAPATVPVLDRAAMLEIVEQDLELLRELVEIFLAECPGLLAQIRSGVQDKNAEHVERSAHTLKGALMNFGAQRACEVARQLEIRGREARLDDAAQLASQLESEVAQACQALSDYLREAVP